jgi:hypothetical protein
MSINVFAVGPINAKTIYYRVNDAVHRPGLQTLYSRRINSGWKAKVMDTSALRVVEERSPGYDPQSDTKKLGPWGSDAKRNEASFEEQRFDDDIRFYNDDFNDWDDNGCNSADEATDEEAFDSCWDKY